MGKEHPISELWRTRMREIGLRRRLRNRQGNKRKPGRL